MQGSYTFRAKAAMAVLAVLALASNLRFLIDAAGQYLSPNRVITDIRLFAPRYAEMRKDLAPGEVVGYLTDVPDPRATSAIAEYNVTQYALAPVIVQYSNDADKLVTNFHKPPSPSLYESHGFRLVKDYGNGAMLLARTKR